MSRTMTLKELKEKLNELSEEYDNYEVYAVNAFIEKVKINKKDKKISFTQKRISIQQIH